MNKRLAFAVLVACCSVMTPGPSLVLCGAVLSVVFGAIVGSIGTFHLNDGISTVRTASYVFSRYLRATQA